MSDVLRREFAADMTTRLARLEIAGMMPEWGRYPVVRLDRSCPLLWGVIA